MRLGGGGGGGVWGVKEGVQNIIQWAEIAAHNDCLLGSKLQYTYFRCSATDTYFW